MEWQPTNHMRLVRRKTIPPWYVSKMMAAGAATRSYYEDILQQKWVREDYKSMKKYFEWRDVPVISEADSYSDTE